MSVHIVLLRGINVGGRNPLPMKSLTALLEALGCRQVKTYIQSGSAVLQSTGTPAALAKQIRAAIGRQFGFEPHVLVLARRELERAIAANPFPDAEADPAGLHLGFLDAVPADPQLDKLDAMAAASERFRLIDKVFYLHAPDGIGRSKLAVSSERLLGVAMTDRNWRTVSKLRDMAQGLAAR